MDRSGIMLLPPWGCLFCVRACWKHTQHTGNMDPLNMTSAIDVDGEFLEEVHKNIYCIMPHPEIKDLNIVHVEKSTSQYFNQSQGQNLGWEAWLQSGGCYVRKNKR